MQFRVKRPMSPGNCSFSCATPTIVEQARPRRPVAWPLHIQINRNVGMIPMKGFRLLNGHHGCISA